jgi:hypothetical protein
LKQNFKKESLLQIATEFHLLSDLQNGNKETKIDRVAHIQIGIRKEKHNQGQGRPFATLSFATFTKKENRERERCSSLLSKLQQNFKRQPLLKIVTNFHVLSLL